MQIMFLLVGGLKHPLINAVMAVLWSVGAVSFASGYATGDPDSRYKGIGLLVRIAGFGAMLTSISAILSITHVL